MRAASLGLLAAILAMVPGAAAHAILLESHPAQGDRFDEAPAEAWVRLTEPVDPAGSRLGLLDSQGRPVEAGETRFEGGSTPTMRLTLPAGLPDGAYSLEWSAFSAVDSHATSGRVGFAVGPFEPPAGAGSETGRLDAPALAARWLAYGGLALALGGAAFAARSRLDEVLRRRLLWDALAAGAALHLAGTLLLAAATRADAGIPWDAFRASVPGRILAGRAVLGAAALLLALLWRSAPASPRPGPWLVAGLLAAAAAGSARLGHGSADGLPIIAMDLLHLLAASLWLGGLAAFAYVLLRPRRFGLDAAAVRATGRRFGTVALAATLVLAATGVAVSLAVLGPTAGLRPSRVLSSTYGWALAGKVALAVAMVGLAAVNRWVFLEDPGRRGLAGAVQRWAGRAMGGAAPPGGRRAFGRVVALEAAIGAAVLLLAGVLTSVSPPVEAAEGPPVLTVGAAGETFHGTLEVFPAPAAEGASTLRVYVADHGGVPVEANTCGRTSCLKLTVGPADGPGALLLPEPEGGGWWRVEEPFLWVASGDHQADLEVQTAEVFQDRMRFLFPVP